MQPRSLALITELGLAATHGRVTDRGEYVVVEVPAMPTWAAANYLALPRVPEPARIAYWIERCEQELVAARTLSFRWDDPSDDELGRAALRNAGFTIDQNEVMAANEVLAPPHAMAIRALESGEVLSTALLAWALADRHDERMRQLLHARASWFADLVDRGVARFYGAFDTVAGASKLVASCGLVDLGPIARYQDVQTLPAYRRRGLAGALLATAARELPGKRYVIMTTADSDGARVYQRVGFQRVERTAIARRNK